MLKDTTQWRRWVSNPQPLYLWATALPYMLKPMDKKVITILLL